MAALIGSLPVKKVAVRGREVERLMTYRNERWNQGSLVSDGAKLRIPGNSKITTQKANEQTNFCDGKTHSSRPDYTRNRPDCDGVVFGAQFRTGVATGAFRDPSRRPRVNLLHAPLHLGISNPLRRPQRSWALLKARMSACWSLLPKRAACPHGCRPRRKRWV